MARVTQATFTVGRTVNLGNYENVRLEHSVTIELEEGETVSGLRDGVTAGIKDTLREMFRQFQPPKQ